MFPFFRSKKQLKLGVDISDEVMRVMALALEGDCYCVTCYEGVSLPVGAVVEREIKDVKGVAEILKQIVKQRGLRGREAVIALPQHKMMTQVVQLPNGLSNDEIAEHFDREIGRYVSYPVDKVNFDFMVLKENNSGPEFIDVLLIICRCEAVDTIIKLMDTADLQLKVIDTETLAMGRVINRLVENLPDKMENLTVALVDIERGKFTLYITHNQQLIYKREHFFGENELPSHIDIVEQIKHALQVFFSATGFTVIDQLIISGQPEDPIGLLKSNLGIPIKMANPLKNMRITSSAKQQLMAVGPEELMRCCGLALRGFIS